jgi:hypothetical protein
MKIELISFSREHTWMNVEYEGMHSQPGKHGTTLTFSIHLRIYEDGPERVQLTKITGLEHLRAESICGIFAEIGRCLSRMLLTVEGCTVSGVLLPTVLRSHPDE